MRNKRTKGYWTKRKEFHPTGRIARSRAGILRTHDHIEHVKMDKMDERYVVTYSIAKWYEKDLEKAGIHL